MGKREKSEMLPVCRKIAAGSLLEHKFQSACVIAAVMLTTVLFTTVFASVFYFQSSIRQAQMENAAWTAHGAVIGVSEEQIRAMAQDSRVSDASCYQHLGFLKDDAADEVIEMQYCEDKLASWMFYEPVWGHMPAGGSRSFHAAFGKLGDSAKGQRNNPPELYGQWHIKRGRFYNMRRI